MSRDDDIACAEAMGWKRQPIPTPAPADPMLPKPTFTIVVDLGGAEYWEAPNGRVYYPSVGYPFGKEQELPHFSSDPAAARLLEDEIERRHITHLYLAALTTQIRELTLYESAERSTGMLWAILRATPEQRARAFLEAIRS